MCTAEEQEGEERRRSEEGKGKREEEEEEGDGCEGKKQKRNVSHNTTLYCAPERRMG